MSPPPLAYTKLWKLLRSLKHTRRRRRQKHLHHDSDDISGAGRKNYGPLNESAPGWDRGTIDHLMSHDVPQQELAQENVPAPDMTKGYVDRFFGFLPPKLLHNIIHHEKSRRRQRIDTYFRSEHGRLPPRISKLLYGLFNPPQYAHKVSTTAAAAAAVPSASPAGPPMAAPLHPAVSPATSSEGSSLDELVRDFLNQENVQQQEIKSAENVVNEMDTFIQVLNSGMRDLKDHLSTAAATPVAHQQQQDTTMSDDDYLRSLLDDFPDFGEVTPSALAPTPPHVSPAAVRYTAMKKLGAPPSSPPPFDSEDDDDSGSSTPVSSSSPPLPLSQRIARKSISNLAAEPDTDSSSSSSRHEQYLQQVPVSEVHRLLCRVFREHATGQRNTRNATHKILDIAHNIAKEHIR